MTVLARHLIALANDFTAWSIERCIPNASPRHGGSTDRAKGASRGADRKPLSIRSATRSRAAVAFATPSMSPNA